MDQKSPLRLLLLEDDPEDLAVFRRHAAVSELYSIDVDHAAMSEDLFHRLSEREYDVIFIDQRLNEAETGLDVLKRVRAERQEPPIITLTGMGTEQLAVEMLKSGAADYLVKETFDSEVLTRSIRHALEEQKAANERRRAEEALRRSEARFRALFSAIPDGVIVHGEQGNILHINDIGAERLEWSAAELTGRNLREFVTPENADLIGDHVHRVRADGSCSFETTYVSRSGRHIAAEVNERPIDFEGRTAILSVSRDVTGRKRLEAEAREAERLRAIRTLAAGVAHNFNNLLMAISGYATFVRDALTDLKAPLDDIDKLLDCAKRAAHLAAHLQNWATSIVAPDRTITLDSVIADLVLRCREESPDNVVLSIEAAAPDVRIKASSDILLKALLNICVNAWEAMPGGGTLTISTRTGLRRSDRGEGEFAIISIADTGGGIALEVREQVFAPFFSTKGTVGVGLGLPLAHNIVEGHGGAIDVQSKPGGGTTIEAFLPVATDQEEA